jgi:hypothetical protein
VPVPFIRPPRNVLHLYSTIGTIKPECKLSRHNPSLLPRPTQNQTTPHQNQKTGATRKARSAGFKKKLQAVNKVKLFFLSMQEHGHFHSFNGLN